MQEQETPIAETQTRNSKDFLGSIMRGDKRIWGIYIALLVISAVEIFSATSQLTYKATYVSDPAFSHIRYLILGFVFVIISQSMSIKSMQAWGKILWAAAVVLAILVPFLGVVQKGAARSIAGFQPVELCKLGVVMTLCSAITAKDSTFQLFSYFRTKTALHRFWFYLALIALATIPIALQNLSSGIIICLASLAIMFLGRVNGKYVWTLLAVSAILGGLFVSSLKAAHDSTAGIENIETVDGQAKTKDTSFSIGSVINRFQTWSNRIFHESDKELWDEDINGERSQELYARMALVNGYPFGKVIGNSKLRDFLPEAFSDYIFAIIFEEWGILAFSIPLFYLSLLLICYRLSRRTKDPYVRLLIMGLPLIMVIQALLHIGVCTGAMFVTGQPLPLISRGGSSIVGTSISFGIILALSRIIKQEQRHALQAETPEDAGIEAPAQN